MFPLGSVLLPGMLLPLHVFEPRYRAMVDRCLAGDHEFGVVLIERGREVGGGDVRTSAGTLARIAEARQFPDGRWALAAELGERVAPVASLELPEDPAALAWAVAAIAPLGPVDRHHVLIAPSLAARLALLQQLLAEQEDVLRFRLSQDD